jgi:hypothetical protein
VPALTAEIARLNAELRAVRLDRANLAAAGRATLAASRDGEPDPLSYLRDELAAQGFASSRDADPVYYLRNELHARQARSERQGRVS